MAERYDNTHYRNVNAMASCCNTKANEEANGELPETSLHQRNDHQGTQSKVEEVTAQDPTISSQIDTNQDAAKASYLINISRCRVHFKGIVSFVARQVTVNLIALRAVAFRLCWHSHNNSLSITTLSRET